MLWNLYLPGVILTAKQLACSAIDRGARVVLAVAGLMWTLASEKMVLCFPPVSKGYLPMIWL